MKLHIVLINVCHSITNTVNDKKLPHSYFNLNLVMTHILHLAEEILRGKIDYRSK